MMLMAERISGKEAERIGLVYKAVPETELAVTVEGIVERLSKAATKSISVIKEQMAVQMDLPYDLAAYHSVATRNSYTLEDTQEGITAFFEKRAPCFTGQ
jgi:enoyl-CoA hydratase/carnithine racemase